MTAHSTNRFVFTECQEEHLTEIDIENNGQTTIHEVTRKNTNHYFVRFRVVSWIVFNFRIGENPRLRGGAYGNAVLGRLPIVADRNHDLTWRKIESRGCLQVTVAYEDEQPGSSGLLQVCNVHLGTGFFERRYQARRLLDVLGDSHGRSTRIILGDFNEWTRDSRRNLLSKQFSSAEPQRRRAGDEPAASPAFCLFALDASDHLPVVADFRLRRIPNI